MHEIFHQTSQEIADLIRNTGVFKAKDPFGAKFYKADTNTFPVSFKPEAGRAAVMKFIWHGNFTNLGFREDQCKLNILRYIMPHEFRLSPGSEGLELVEINGAAVTPPIQISIE